MGEHTPAPSPGRSYYGFVLYLLGWGCIITYLIWAMVPHSYLSSLGLTYIPQPYWALAFPTVMITLVLVFVFLIYPSINFLLAIPPHDIRNISDGMALKEEDYSHVGLFTVPPVYDLNISHVCRELHMSHNVS